MIIVKHTSMNIMKLLNINRYYIEKKKKKIFLFPLHYIRIMYLLYSK